MFAAKLRQIYRVTDKVIIRTIRNRRLYPEGLNPGLDHRVKSFESEGLQLKDEDIEELVEQSESDLYNVGEVYNEHMNETLIGKYELRHHLIKEKYFKQNMPNLLTWSEKEQIRHLASTEPNEWTPERLAESFPVTVPVVKKLLKYPWKPATKERIARHDASVMRNWKELQEGTLDIPQDIRKRLLKFSNRVIPPLKQESINETIELKQEDNLGEFESIVRRCAAREQQSSTQTSDESRLAFSSTSVDCDGEMKSEAKIDPKRVTLEQLASKIKKRLETGKDVDIADKIIVDSMKTTEDVSRKPEQFNHEIELINENNDKNTLVKFKDKDVAPAEIMNYPERIRIPKKVYKKGATYKVNDCFYDHDGKFLYRVLGMSN